MLIVLMDVLRGFNMHSGPSGVGIQVSSVLFQVVPVGMTESDLVSYSKGLSKGNLSGSSIAGSQIITLKASGELLAVFNAVISRLQAQGYVQSSQSASNQ